MELFGQFTRNWTPGSNTLSVSRFGRTSGQSVGKNRTEGFQSSAGVFHPGAIGMAIASTEEERHSLAPLKLFSLFDPSEPLFDCWGWHPAIVYRRVKLLFGRPLWITDAQRRQDQGKQGASLARELTQSCFDQIAGLLHQGCY